MKKIMKYLVCVTVIWSISSLLTSFALSAGKIKILGMGPSKVQTGIGFNVQPNGSSAMWVKTENATKDMVIVWGTEKLPTTYNNPNLLTAIVPKALYSKPGKFNIYLLDQKNNEKSNSLALTVK